MGKVATINRTSARDNGFRPYQFVPKQRFSWDHDGEKDSEGNAKVSWYVPGKTYTARTKKLDARVKQWAKQGKVTILE